MADKKLNAVSTASDGAYVYAEDASGNQIKISKADLATVVAGLFPFYPKPLESSDDLNELLDGPYFYTNNETPINSPGLNCLLIQLSTPTRKEKYQIVFGYNSRSVHMRMFAGSWTEWKQAFYFI